MKEIMLGNSAIARGAYEAGVKIAVGYPGTPSTEVMQAVHQYEGMYSEWSVNEKVAMDVAIGASLGRWPDALTNADPFLPFHTDTETLRAYFVVTTQLVPGEGGDWDWGSAPSTRIIGTAGILYLRVAPDALDSDTLFRPFLGVEVIGQNNLTLALEYRFKDSGIEDDSLFSALIRYPIDEHTNLEVGLANASPIGLAGFGLYSGTGSDGLPLPFL